MLSPDSNIISPNLNNFTNCTLIGDINKSPWIIGDIHLMTLIDGIQIMVIITINLLKHIINYSIELTNSNFINDKYNYIQIVI